MRITGLTGLLFLSVALSSQPLIDIEAVASGFDRPVDIVHADDDRLFIVEKGGTIRIIDENNNVLATPFLDIENRVNDSASERGLLGLAFHPDYANNGYFFVNYTDNSGGDTRVARFRVSDENPNQADPNSEVILMEFNQPFSNHNGGDLCFGPDGYLYISTGDGGSGGDPQNNAQNRLNFLGKILRIDVDNGNPYSIPETNPFAFDDFTLDEIWALGLRNPWRISFDRLTGDLWIGDVGQNDYEEISFQPADSPGGENYGWRCYEGFEPYNTSNCEDEAFYTPPVFAYAHSFSVGCSITGGYVYHGTNFPSLAGRYLYADFCSGNFWALTPNPDGTYTNDPVYDGIAGEYSSFGEDQEGELYVAAYDLGIIYRIVDGCPPVPNIEQAGTTLSTGDNYDAYQWFLNGEPIEGASAPELEMTQSGNYQVAVTNERNCTTLSEEQFFDIVRAENLLPVQQVQLAPNPARDRLRLQFSLPEAQDLHWQFINEKGQQLQTGQWEIAQQIDQEWSIADLPTGIYWIRIKGQTQEISIPFQKQ